MTETRSSVSPFSAGDGAVPNLFLVGAPKSGTTGLSTYLTQHPDVYVAPRELSYFGSDLDFRTRRGRPWHISRDAYLAWFSPHAGCRYLGDHSVFYLYSARAAAEIGELCPSARVVIMLRDPVDQMHSQHSEMLYQGDEDIRDFATALEAEQDRREGRRVPAGCQKTFGLFYRALASYATQVERYLAIFGAEQVCVLLYDELVADPEALYARVLEFLGLDEVTNTELGVVNSNKELRSVVAMKILHRSPPLIRRLGRAVVRDEHDRAALRRRIHAINTRHRPRAPLHAELRNRLHEEFLEETERLEVLIGRDLSAWKPDT